MWSWLLWGWASASAQPSSASTTPARAIPVYGSQEVESALLMAAQSLAIKNRAIDALQAQLESATACLAVAREQGSHASLVTDAARQQVMASAVDAARAAEVAQLQGRCHSAEQQVAALTVRLADAQALSKQQALDIASAHERSAAVKLQLAAVKAELAEAKAAQASAVTALVELEAALADLREESRSLRQEKEEVGAAGGCCAGQGAPVAYKVNSMPWPVACCTPLSSHHKAIFLAPNCRRRCRAPRPQPNPPAPTHPHPPHTPAAAASDADGTGVGLPYTA